MYLKSSPRDKPPIVVNDWNISKYLDLQYKLKAHSNKIQRKTMFTGMITTTNKCLHSKSVNMLTPCVSYLIHIAVLYQK